MMILFYNPNSTIYNSDLIYIIFFMFAWPIIYKQIIRNNFNENYKLLTKKKDFTKPVYRIKSF